MKWKKNWVIYNMLYWSDGYREIELGWVITIENEFLLDKIIW